MLYDGIAYQMRDRRMSLPRNPVKLGQEPPRPSNLVLNGVNHAGNTGIASPQCQHICIESVLDSATVPDVTLGALIASRRRPLTQGELARLVPGWSRTTLGAVELGETKTIPPRVANELVKVIPVTMAELVRAMGYDLPVRQTPLEPWMVEVLETASETELESVRALLHGFQVLRQQRPPRERVSRRKRPVPASLPPGSPGP